jgi:peptidoglycan hydrolase-like protein with peptidoglycan-binding domain
MESAAPDSSEESRADRLDRRRGWRRRLLVIGSVLAILVVGGIATYALVWNADTSSADTQPSIELESTIASRPSTTATTKPKPTTTTTTIPPVKNPKKANLPSPGDGIGMGTESAEVMAYEARMTELKFDPGEVDGYFDSATQYAVIGVQKYYKQEPTGVIDGGVQLALNSFAYSPAMAKSEGDRVEIDLDKQMLTVFRDWQPTLLTTTSTGNGEYFCGGVDGCQYAVTPTGHYHFYSLYNGWQNGKLGRMYNPYYFNGGIAVHGLAEVPTYPASHGCARIPMYVAEYFPTMVFDGMSVFVVGTPQQAGDEYVGPVRNNPAPETVPATTTPPVTATATPTTTPPTKPPTSPPTTRRPTPTTRPPTPTTSPPTTPTT